MTGTLTVEERSTAMSKVRSADTKPEWIIRCGLHRLGFRYRLKNKHLPGKPDLVFPKYRSAVFVHGCYWHRHLGCRNVTMPKNNVRFWIDKFQKNTDRDCRKQRLLLEQGWRVLVVWECELVNYTVETIEKVSIWLRQGANEEIHLIHEKSVLNRRVLLNLAEKKIRLRIESYHQTNRKKFKKDLDRSTSGH